MGARGTDESHATVTQPYFPIKFKNRTPLLAAVQKESGGLPTPADQSESVPTILQGDDFVLLKDDIKHWIVRIEDISVLEAHQNFTIAHFPNGKVLIRRSLADCERRLDSPMFFRASRDFIVNLSQVKQSRLSKDKNRGLIFLLKDGKEVVFSPRQSVLFRKTHGL